MGRPPPYSGHRFRLIFDRIRDITSAANADIWPIAISFKATASLSSISYLSTQVRSIETIFSSPDCIMIWYAISFFVSIRLPRWAEYGPYPAFEHLTYSNIIARFWSRKTPNVWSSIYIFSLLNEWFQWFFYDAFDNIYIISCFHASRHTRPWIATLVKDEWQVS